MIKTCQGNLKDATGVLNEQGMLGRSFLPTEGVLIPASLRWKDGLLLWQLIKGTPPAPWIGPHENSTVGLLDAFVNISNVTQSIPPRSPNMYPSYKKDRALIGTFIFSTLFAQVASDDPKSGA